MNPGDSVHDASRSGLDDASRPGAAAGYGNDTPAQSPRAYKTVQDIQDLVDKLAAVTQQLGRHGRSVPGSVTLAPEAPQHAQAVLRSERGGAQPRERADEAGDVRLALPVDAAG
jgi:hypothetical protein